MSTNTFTKDDEDEGVEAVIDYSHEVLVDSFTTMSHSLLPPHLMQPADSNNDDDSAKLTLAYEGLYELPRTIVERFADHIMYLDISHNKITNLDLLVHFKHLTSLIADNNPITENCFLPPLPKLQLLWLNRCRLRALHPWLGALRGACPALRLLSLMANPAAPGALSDGTFYDYLQYRLYVVSQFPQLEHLDERRVSADERAEALRLYRPARAPAAPLGALAALAALLPGRARARNLPV